MLGFNEDKYILGFNEDKYILGFNEEKNIYWVLSSPLMKSLTCSRMTSA